MNKDKRQGFLLGYTLGLMVAADEDEAEPIWDEIVHNMMDDDELWPHYDIMRKLETLKEQIDYLTELTEQLDMQHTDDDSNDE